MTHDQVKTVAKAIYEHDVATAIMIIPPGPAFEWEDLDAASKRPYTDRAIAALCGRDAILGPSA